MMDGGVPAGGWRGVRRRAALRAGALLAVFAAAGLPAFAAMPLDHAGLRRVLGRELQRFAERHAPPRLAEPPPWARRPDPPAATIAVLADIHYDDSGVATWTRASRERLTAAIRFLNTTIKPQRVLLLGDIIAFEGISQLRRVKQLLDGELAAPYTAVWGNHDGPGFETVFGTPHTSLAVGGLRLITIGLTYTQWDAGWGRYERLDWLARELAANPREPTLVLTHNPVAFPTFANNAEVLRVLDAQPQVLGILAGHLHVDYELSLAKVHFGFPMFARPPHAFKVLRIYPDAIHILTYGERDGAWRQAPVYQKLDVPPPLRPPATRPR